jgi:hypothetical protein
VVGTLGTPQSSTIDATSTVTVGQSAGTVNVGVLASAVAIAGGGNPVARQGDTVSVGLSCAALATLLNGAITGVAPGSPCPVIPLPLSVVLTGVITTASTKATCGG